MEPRDRSLNSMNYIYIYIYICVCVCMCVCVISILTYIYIYIYIFPTEIALTIKRPDIVIWSVEAKKIFVIELMVPCEENFDWAYQ